MTQKTYDYSMLQAFVKLFRLPWSGVTAIIAGVLGILLILAAYLDGNFSNEVDWSFWRLGLQPTIIVYIFVIIPMYQRLWARAIQSLRTLLPLPDPVNKIATFNRKAEWTALFLGTVFTVILAQPWRGTEHWLDWYGFITGIIMFSLLSLLIYHGLSETTQLARISRYHLKIEIFESELLIPVARWSLSLSLAFIGGTTLSVLFQPIENLLSISSLIIYATLIGVTLILFFTSMWSIHNTLASAKKRELTMVRKNLSSARENLKRHVNESRPDARIGKSPISLTGPRKTSCINALLNL